MKTTSRVSIGSSSNRLTADTLLSSKTFRKKFGRFPNQSRVQIYQQLLGIPFNGQSFVQISKMSIDNIMMPKHLPVKSRTLYLLWQQITGFLCNFFQCNVMWIPQIIHPWIRLMQKHTILQVFQVCLSIIQQYYADIFRSYPDQSDIICNILDDIHSAQYPQTHGYLRKQGFRFSKVIWPTFCCCFSNTSTQTQWQNIWDYILCSQSDNILLGFTVVWGQTILQNFKGNNVKQLQNWLSLQRQVLCLQKMLQHSQLVADNYKIRQRLQCRWVLPLSKPYYTKFNIKPSKRALQLIQQINIKETKQAVQNKVNKNLQELDRDIGKLISEINHQVVFSRQNLELSLKKKHNKMMAIAQQNMMKMNEFNEVKVQQLNKIQKQTQNILKNGQIGKSYLSNLLSSDQLVRRKINQLHSNIQKQTNKVKKLQQQTVKTIKDTMKNKISTK